MGRIDEAGLIDLWEEIEADPAFAHLRTPGINLVPGIGSSRPLAMVVGEAPGAQENTHRRPFCGPSGRVLHQLMALSGLYARPTRSELAGYEIDANVWLTNAIKYRPPGNRTPGLLEVMAAQPHLRKEWVLVGRPRLIVCCGSVAATAFGQHTPSMIRRGELYPMKDGKTFIAYQYHPAYGLRGDDKRKAMIEEQWEIMARQIEDLKEELRWT